VDVMAYWTFSDVFEEQGVIKQPFYGGFGVLAENGVPKPAFNTFKVLHRLGETRLKLDSDSAIVTKRKNGTLVIAIWNLVTFGQSGTDKQFDLQLPPNMSSASATLSRVDSTHGNVMPAYVRMGSPVTPSQAQWKQLRAAGELPTSETVPIQGGHLKLTLPPNGLAVLEVK
jgi:xylan 1,4-beta-xylosidase